MQIKSCLSALIFLLTAFIIAAPFASVHAANKKIKEIDAKELKAWIDSGKSFKLIDARPKKFENGELIVGAIFLPYNAEEDEITKALPAKDAIIVTYCSSSECPASTYLAKHLVKMGYKSIYKYTDGLEDWMDKGYPTTEAKTSKDSK
jgi:rhodanese-related sulfurtransferase